MKLKITIDDKTYEIEVEAAEPEQNSTVPRDYVMQPAPVRVPAESVPVPSAADAPVANEDKVCRSPIAGVAVKISAQPGQTIKTGDILIVLEAMKMETNITAPIDGIISKVNISAGDSVKNGQILVEFQ